MCFIVRSQCQVIKHRGRCLKWFINENCTIWCPRKNTPHRIREHEESWEGSKCETCARREELNQQERQLENSAASLGCNIIWGKGYRSQSPASDLPGPRVMSPSAFEATGHHQDVSYYSADDNTTLPGATQAPANAARFPGDDSSDLSSPVSSVYVTKRRLYNSQSESSESEARSSQRQGSSQAASSVRSSECYPSSSYYTSSSEDGSRNSQKSTSVGSSNHGKQDTGKKRKHSDRGSSGGSSRHSSQGGGKPGSLYRPAKK